MASGPATGELTVWAMGAEGEKLPDLLKDFQAAARDLTRKLCQQMSAADLSTFDRLYESLYARCAPRWRP